MGFRTGAFAKIWEITPISDTSTKLRISISRKNKQTDTYEQDFSGFVLCVGISAARKALSLTDGSRIKLGDVDVTTKYDESKKMSYTNFKLFSFDDVESGTTVNNPEPQRQVDDGEVEEGSSLPF